MDEAVAGKRRDGLGVEAGERARLGGDEAEHRGAPLPERALERALLGSGS